MLVCSYNIGSDGHISISCTIPCVIYWPLTEPSIKRYTYVNKRKKRKPVDVMKKYRHVRVAVELVSTRNVRVRASLQSEGCGPQRPPVEQHQPRCGRSAAIVWRKSWVNIAVCHCFHPSLTHPKSIENKVWDTYFYKEVCSLFFEVRKLRLIIFLLNIYICICIRVVCNTMANYLIDLFISLTT